MPPDPRTDAQGHITFESVPEGSYVVFVEIGIWKVGCGTLQVPRTKLLPVPIQLGPYSIRVRVLDAGGRFVTSAKPRIYLQGARWHRVSPRPFLDNPQTTNGVYVIPYARHGRYGASANANAAQARGKDIQVGPDSPNPEVTLQLPATGTLVVRVVDKRGNPLEGVHVRVERPAGTPRFEYQTNKNGEIRLLHLTAETWRVGLAELLAWKGEPTDVKVGPLEETRVELVAPRHR